MSVWENIKGSLAYDTVQIVRIKDWRLGLTHLMVQALILIYITASLIYGKQYQDSEVAVGTTNAKTQGLTYTNLSSVINFWDAGELVVPPHEPDATFITTNMWITYNQTQEQCASSMPCQSDEDCAGFYTSEGFLAGWCTNEGFCAVNSWCPLEDEPEDPQWLGLYYISNFTIFVRNNAHWPGYGQRRDNVGSGLEPGKNFWSLRELLDLNGLNFEDIKVRGALLAMSFEWNCNFDLDPLQCSPDISMYRLDNPEGFSPGYNFRRTLYQSSDPMEPFQSRTLIKHYGIRIIFMTSGLGRRFSWSALFTSIGAGLGLLTISTLICDFASVRLCGKERSVAYAKTKFTDFRYSQHSRHNELDSVEKGNTDFENDRKGSVQSGSDYALMN